MPRARVVKAYHHGDLRSVLLCEAARAIESEGSAALSLRELARRAGVSHAAPSHHFGDKTGLLTALAAQGFERLHDALAQALAQAPEPHRRFREAGLAYARFAIAHPSHFEVMFRPGQLHARDAAYVAAKARALALLMRAVQESHAGALARGVPLPTLVMAAWSSVHGFATLWIDGNLSELVGKHGIEPLAESVLGFLDDAVAQAQASKATPAKKR